jgi:hypothetical protein
VGPAIRIRGIVSRIIEQRTRAAKREIALRAILDIDELEHSALGLGQIRELRGGQCDEATRGIRLVASGSMTANRSGEDASEDCTPHQHGSCPHPVVRDSAVFLGRFTVAAVRNLALKASLGEFSTIRLQNEVAAIICTLPKLCSRDG